MSKSKPEIQEPVTVDVPCVGIDGAKDKHDIFIDTTGESFIIENSSAAIAKLATKLEKRASALYCPRSGGWL
jgi:hypothetical protein